MGNRNGQRELETATWQSGTANRELWRRVHPSGKPHAEQKLLLLAQTLAGVVQEGCDLGSKAEVGAEVAAAGGCWLTALLVPKRQVLPRRENEHPAKSAVVSTTCQALGRTFTWMSAVAEPEQSDNSILFVPT